MIYEMHGMRFEEDELPQNHSIIDVYTPHSCPWDYYGMKHQRECSRVLKDANIPCVLLQTRITNLYPIGSGPGGRVRFGDNMCPGEFRIAVPCGLEAKAKLALEDHKKAVNLWLDGKGVMPDACKNW